MITVVDVRGWLKIPTADTADDEVLADVVAAVNAWVLTVPYVANIAGADPPPPWPADVQQGAVMLAARLYRRRNTPSGVESYTDNVVYLPRRDGDVDTLLHLTRPVIG